MIKVTEQIAAKFFKIFGVQLKIDEPAIDDCTHLPTFADRVWAASQEVAKVVGPIKNNDSDMSNTCILTEK